MARTDYKMILGILLGFGIISVFGIAIIPVDSSQPQGIPPTPALKTIYAGPTANDNVTALNYSSHTNFTAGTGMTILADYLANKITFSSIAGSISTFESLTNVTNTGCALNQIPKVNSTGFWACSDDSTGTITTLESLTNVTDVGCAIGQVRKASAGNWICANDDNTGSVTTLESLTNVTDVGCANGQVRTASGGQWICSTISGGATTLDDLTDVTLTGQAYGHIIQYNQALAQWINKLFRIDTQSAANDFQIVGINNQTGAITRNQFSVNTIDAGYNSRLKSIDNVTGQVTFDTVDFIDTTNCGYGSRVQSVDNVTGVVTCDTIDFIDTTTCSGTDKVSAINNITGAVTCTADSGGAGGGGIPLPPKKWGELIPKSAVIGTSSVGLVQGCTILATATFVYDTTDNSNAILSTTAVTDGINGGIHCTTTNFNSFRGDQNAYMYSKWEANKITTNRIFIGFTSGSTLLPNNADTILDSLIGVGLCIRTTDTVYQFCRNDGDATTDYVSTGITEDALVHYFEVYTTDAGVNWCGKIDGGSATCWSTEIPTPTTRLYAESTGETDGGGSAILWTQYLWYLTNDK